MNLGIGLKQDKEFNLARMSEKRGLRFCEGVLFQVFHVV